MSSHYELRSYMLSLLKFIIIKSSRQKEIVLKRQKEKDSMKITKNFIHIEYSLQVEVHCYYNVVQDTTLQIDTRAVYTNNLLASYGDVS